MRSARGIPLEPVTNVAVWLPSDTIRRHVGTFPKPPAHTPAANILEPAIRVDHDAQGHQRPGHDFRRNHPFLHRPGGCRGRPFRGPRAGLVTVAMEKVEFHHPVFVGDLVSFNAEVVRVGNTSITVRVEVIAERRREPRRVKVTEATVVYVHVDDQGRPLQVPPRAGERAAERLERP